jgi:hypothetical protein
MYGAHVLFGINAIIWEFAEHAEGAESPFGINGGSEKNCCIK